MTTPTQLTQLIQRFRDNLPDYKAGKYNETQVRREFIDPLFKLLGWDIDNEKGYAEAYKEVVHEDAIKVGQATKAPDYSFRIGGSRKFFLEAKKPSVNIKEGTHPAYQLRRYAWSAKLPLSILTDFEEFAVYDCRVQPVQTDRAAAARIMYLTYEQYPDQWEHLVNTFSPEAVHKGAFDRYVESTRAKKGTTEVDSAFLQEIERWRDSLARNLALRNSLSQRQLNFAVQRIIDRIIFLRIAEDRGLEPYGQLRDLANAPNIYSRLTGLFRRADDRYNSGLFHFKAEKGRQEEPDSLTPSLAVDDKILKDIFKNIYYPDSPYEFSVLTADILGQVYEQFLGKVIRLSHGGRRAEVEDKPEVKKAGGVFYTPIYIVNYIVRQTVGQLVEGKKPGQVEGLKIADPACGSGSFLLGAYQFLLDWYRDQYILDNPDKWARSRSPRLYPSGNGGWKLTLAERKGILLDHIYGVDIDPQAVEVTKLSLLLRVLEDEKSLSPQLELIQQRVLPDLGDNIKCGNSLIGPDFYSSGQQLALFDEEDMHRVNAFDWQAEFPAIMRAGGFDVVIGNPPYVRQEELGEYKGYFEKHYKSSQGTADLYVYFIERSLSLLKRGGLYSIIVSKSFLHTTFATKLRKFIRESSAILSFVDFGGLAVFENAKDTYVCIPLLSNGAQPENVQVAEVQSLYIPDLSQHVKEQKYFIESKRFAQGTWSLKPQIEIDLLSKIRIRGTPLGQFTGIYYGVKTGFNEAFVIDATIREKLILEHPSSANLIKPLLGGQDIRRYLVRPTENYLIFTRRGINIDSYPAIKNYLTQYKQALTPRPKDWTGSWSGRKPGPYQWYEIQDSVDYYQIFEQPKIIYPDIAKGPRFHLDNNGTYIANTAYCLGTGDLYLLGILNSRLFWFTIGNISIPFGTRAGEYRYRLIYQYMEQVPIRPIDFTNPTDKARHERMVALVEQMHNLHQRLAGESVPQTRTVLQRQIEATDKQIDRLVYELYGLNDEEIKIVEGKG